VKSTGISWNKIHIASGEKMAGMDAAFPIGGFALRGGSRFLSHLSKCEPGHEKEYGESCNSHYSVCFSFNHKYVKRSLTSCYPEVTWGKENRTKEQEQEQNYMKYLVLLTNAVCRQIFFY
jgi:hypothetical protein